MQTKTTAGGFWSQCYPDYVTRLEQMAKLFRAANITGNGLDVLSNGLTLTPKD